MSEQKDQDDAHLVSIVREGLKTDFWKFLKDSCEGLRDGALADMRRPVKTLDDVLKLIQASATCRNAELYLRWPETVLQSIEQQKKAKLEADKKALLNKIQYDPQERP